MKKILILIAVVGITLTSCDKFLDENPNLAGSNVIYNTEQLNQMLNEMNYVMKGSSWGTGVTANFAPAIASDDLEFHPEIQEKAGAQDKGLISILDRDYMQYTFNNYYEFSRFYNAIYVMNTILYNLPIVTGEESEKLLIEAEAKAFRAMFHFSSLLVYAHHPALGDNLGLGYRDDINFESENVKSRKTSQYTMDRIYQDIDEALAIFDQLEHDVFDVSRNWRFNKVNLTALKARIDLYNGKYQDALNAASYVLTKYSHINDFNVDVNPDDPYYTVVSTTPYILADGTPYDLDVSWMYFTKDFVLVQNDEEMLISYFTSNPFGGALPMSESLYNTYNLKNDLRLLKYYSNNSYMSQIGVSNFTKSELDAIDSYKWSNFQGASSKSTASSLKYGPSVPEMMLIKAECLVRGEDGVAKDDVAALTLLHNLRYKRFEVPADAENITATVQNVLDERRREMPLSIRWYDLKRLNAVGGENITLSKKYFTNPLDAKSGEKLYSFAPNSNYYTLPIPDVELSLLEGWEQNPE